jgi:hypothetical protein
MPAPDQRNAHPSRWLLAFYHMPLAAHVVFAGGSCMSTQPHSDEKLLVEQVFRQLLPEHLTPLVNPQKRAIAFVWGLDSPQNNLEVFTA